MNLASCFLCNKYGVIRHTIKAFAALLLRIRHDVLCLYLDCPGTETGFFERALAQ